LVALIIIIFLGNPVFLTRYNLKVIGNAATVLLAVGAGQVWAILLGGIDLSVGGIMAFVSVVFIKSIEAFGYLGFPIALVAGGLAGFLNGLIISRLRIPSFVCTLGVGGILVSLTYLITPAALSPPSSVHKYLDVVNGSILGINNGWFIALGLFLVYFFIQRYTLIGKLVMGVGSNERMARLSGVNIPRVKTVSYVLSGVGAGVAAIILGSYLYSGYPTLGDVYILQSIAVVVVGGTALTGGTGGLPNTLIGALIMSVVQNGMHLVGVTVYAQQAVLGSIIIIAVAVTIDRSKLEIIK
jgi:ribose/xylose/arabinose/galactoside ABC-type transport system permease subunit